MIPRQPTAATRLYGTRRVGGEEYLQFCWNRVRSQDALDVPIERRRFEHDDGIARQKAFERRAGSAFSPPGRCRALRPAHTQPQQDSATEVGREKRWDPHAECVFVTTIAFRMPARDLEVSHPRREQREASIAATRSRTSIYKQRTRRPALPRRSSNEPTSALLSVKVTSRRMRSPATSPSYRARKAGRISPARIGPP